MIKSNESGSDELYEWNYSFEYEPVDDPSFKEIELFTTGIDPPCIKVKVPWNTDFFLSQLTIRQKKWFWLRLARKRFNEWLKKS